MTENIEELIPTQKGNFGGHLIPTVNARDLWIFLESGQEFANWIRNRIRDYGFAENQDFLIILSKSTGGRPAKEYYVTLDMGKELSMVERTARGRQARRYFIECERRLRQMESSPVSLLEELARCIPPAMKSAEAIGLEGNDAVQAARNMIQHAIGYDLARIMGIEDRLAPPDTSERVAEFADRECRKAPGRKMIRAELFARFALYCSKKGWPLPGMPDFFEALSDEVPYAKVNPKSVSNILWRQRKNQN
ncbi:antA/AntB antirepressor family protein [Desulfobacterales bacterium HSG2]|nr:antA/AntB antirepressor family protein [Desulfobacterales bacterium HSG2]